MDQKKAGVLLSYGQTVLSTVISLVYTPVMLRLLGTSEYGTYTLVSGFISNLSLMSFGLGSAYVRYYSRAKVQEGEDGVAHAVSPFVDGAVRAEDAGSDAREILLFRPARQVRAKGLLVKHGGSSFAGWSDCIIARIARHFTPFFAGTDESEMHLAKTRQRRYTI